MRAKTRLPDGHGFVTVAVLLICNFLTDVHLIALSVHFVPAEIVRCIIAEQLVALYSMTPSVSFAAGAEIDTYLPQSFHLFHHRRQSQWLIRCHRQP